MDPLTELAGEGARWMLAEALKADANAFVANFADERMAVSDLCGTDLALNGKSRQGLVLWMSSGPRCATGWHPRSSIKDPFYIEHTSEMGPPDGELGCITR